MGKKNSVKKIGGQEIKAALAKLEETDLDAANLLRAALDGSVVNLRAMGQICKVTSEQMDMLAQALKRAQVMFERLEAARE
jgi:hypothetical protein